jgi:hypothetical protein
MRLLPGGLSAPDKSHNSSGDPQTFWGALAQRKLKPRLALRKISPKLDFHSSSQRDKTAKAKTLGKKPMPTNTVRDCYYKQQNKHSDWGPKGNKAIYVSAVPQMRILPTEGSRNKPLLG